MMQAIKLPFLAVVLFIVSIPACLGGNSSADGYREEVRHFCQVHNFDYWKSTGKLDELNAMRPTDKQRALIEEIHASVTSPELEAIVFTKGERVTARRYYSYLQKEIPKLTGEPFDCPAIAEFYVTGAGTH